VAAGGAVLPAATPVYQLPLTSGRHGLAGLAPGACTKRMKWR